MIDFLCKRSPLYKQLDSVIYGGVKGVSYMQTMRYQHLIMYAFRGREGGLRERTFCTFVKMLIIMADPLNNQNAWAYIVPELSQN